jgi:hypothetical protein
MGDRPGSSILPLPGCGETRAPKPLRPPGRAPRVHRPAKTTATISEVDPELIQVARELAVQSRREQGLPDHVTDPAALARGAGLVLALRRRTTRPRAGTPP